MENLNVNAESIKRIVAVADDVIEKISILMVKEIQNSNLSPLESVYATITIVGDIVESATGSLCTPGFGPIKGEDFLKLLTERFNRGIDLGAEYTKAILETIPTNLKN